MKYDISIISFFDILGFKDCVNNNPDPGQVLELLEEFKRHSEPDKWFAEAYELKFANFSDLFVRGVNILSKANKDCRIGILFHELLNLLHIQASLIMKGIFVRGGVTIGGIFFDHNHVFGPGFNEAYKLEQEVAVYPRIVIAPEIFLCLKEAPLLRAHHHDWRMEAEHIREFISQGEDGVWFIDYLKGMEPECNDSWEYRAFLEKHKDLILRKIRGTKKLDRVSLKYWWLAQYHNKIINEFSKRSFELLGCKKKDLAIAKRSMKLLGAF